MWRDDGFSCCRLGIFELGRGSRSFGHGAALPTESGSNVRSEDILVTTWLVSVGGAATASRQFASLPSFNLFIHSRALSPVSEYPGRAEWRARVKGTRLRDDASGGASKSQARRCTSGAATASRQFASLPSFNLFIHSRALSPVSLKKPAYTPRRGLANRVRIECKV
jgi:hypothetical protein